MFKPFVAFVLWAVVLNGLATACSDVPVKSSQGTTSQEDLVANATTTLQADAIVSEILTLTNQERKTNGLSPLTLNPKLNQAAQKHAENMAKQGIMSHELDGRSMRERVEDENYKWTSLAENVAMGYPTPKAVVTGWMKSPGHRTNILSRNTQIGIGYATSAAGELYWCQVFGIGK